MENRDCEGTRNATLYTNCEGIHIQYTAQDTGPYQNETVTYEPFVAVVGADGETGLIIQGDNVWVQSGGDPLVILPTTELPDVSPEQTDPLADTRTAVAACVEGVEHIVKDEGPKLNSTEHTIIEFDVHKTCNDEFFPTADPSKVPATPIAPQTLPYNLSYVPDGVFGIFPWNVTVQRPIYQFTPVGLPEGNPTLLQQWTHEGDAHEAFLTSTADTVWFFATGASSTRLLLKSSSAEIILGHGHEIFHNANWHHFRSWYDPLGGMLTAKGLGFNALGFGFPTAYMSGDTGTNSILVNSDIGWVPGKTVGFSLGESGYGIYNTYGFNIHIKSPYEITILTASPSNYVTLRPTGPQILTIPSHEAGIVFNDERYMLKLYGDYEHIPGAPGWPMVLQGYTGVLLGKAFSTTDPPDDWVYFEGHTMRTDDSTFTMLAELYMYNYRLHLSTPGDDHYWIDQSNNRVTISGWWGARIHHGETDSYLNIDGPQVQSSTTNLFMYDTNLGVMQGRKIYFSAFSTTENPMDMQTFPNPPPPLPENVGGLTFDGPPNPSSVDGGYWMGYDPGAGRMAIQSYTGLLVYATGPASGISFVNHWINTYADHLVFHADHAGHSGHLFLGWPSNQDFTMTYKNSGATTSVELIRVDNDGGDLPSPGVRFSSQWDTYLYGPATTNVRGDAAVQINAPYVHFYSDVGGPGIITDTNGAFSVQTLLGHSVYLGVDGGAHHAHLEISTIGLTWLESVQFSHAGPFENHYTQDTFGHHEHKYLHPAIETTDTAWYDHEITGHCGLYLWELKHTSDSCVHSHEWHANQYILWGPPIINPAAAEDLTETEHICLKNGTDCRDVVHTKPDKHAGEGDVPILSTNVKNQQYLVNITAPLDVTQRVEAATLVSPSDQRLKKSIVDVEKATSIGRIKALRPVEYAYTAAYRAIARTTASRVRGFLSQEVQVCVRNVSRRR